MAKLPKKVPDIILRMRENRKNGKDAFDFDSVHCYSCGMELLKEKAILLGKDVYRCEDCEVGKKKWFRNLDKNDEFYGYWVTTLGTEEEIKTWRKKVSTYL